MNGGENIAVVPRLLGWKTARIADRVDELLELVQLDPATFRDRRPARIAWRPATGRGGPRAGGAAGYPVDG